MYVGFMLIPSSLFSSCPKFSVFLFFVTQPHGFSQNEDSVKQYNLVPHRSMSTDFVRFNPLVPKEQRVLYKVCASSPKVCNADTKTLDAALAVIQGTKPSPKVSASPKHAPKSRCDTGNQSSFNNLLNSSV